MKQKSNLKEKQKPGVVDEILSKKKEVLFCCGIFFITLAVYISTLAPSVYFGHSGELTAAAYNLGIAHPPGYPLYLLLGKLFMLLVPFGDMAMRMNLLSAVFAALTTVLVYLIGRALNHHRLTATLTALIAAFSFTFWSQAVVAEVYTLAALFFCTLILFTLLWLKDRQEHWLLLLALTAGFAMTHHVIIAVFLPVFLIFILLNKPGLLKDWKLIARSIPLFLLPLLLYLYLPIRSAANPLNDWGNPETFSRMINHVTGKQFDGLFLKQGAAGVMFQWHIFVDALLKQFPFILLILAVIGVIAGLKREKKIVFFFLALPVVGICYSLAYFITNVEPQFIYIFLCLALIMGMSLDGLYRWMRKGKKNRFPWVVAGILTIIALLPLAVNRTKCDQSGNYLARNYGRNMISTLEKDSALIIDGENELFIAAYLKIVEGLRPDVEVYDAMQNIFYIPAMKTKDKDKKTVTVADLYQFVNRMLTGKKPVFFTNPIFQNFRFADYGVLYKAILGSENLENFKIEDPWEKYDRSGLERPYPGANEKETIGKYYFSRGKYLDKTNKKDLAVDFLGKALSVAGDQHSALKNLAIYYMQTSKLDDAESIFEKAIKVYPFDSDDYNTLGMIYHYRTDYTNALEKYTQALAIKGNNVSALMNRSMLYEQMGDKETNQVIKNGCYQNALNDCEQALGMEPANPAAAQMKTRIFSKVSQ
ncbi:MAG: DUF2723 domain-containing protein [Candidatus Aminicenantes bacterium]|nr:DUF2723 domain-containing protein [Candidatus Aminicenantes bacterium]